MGIIEEYQERVEKELLLYRQEHIKDKNMPVFFWEQKREAIYLADDEYKELFDKLHEPDVPFFDMLVLMDRRDKRKEAIEKEIREKEFALTKMPPAPDGCFYNLEGQIRRYSKAEYKEIYKHRFSSKSLWDLYAEHDRLQEQYNIGKFERMFEVKIKAIEELIKEE